VARSLHARHLGLLGETVQMPQERFTDVLAELDSGLGESAQVARDLQFHVGQMVITAPDVPRACVFSGSS
jgi:hypothetical protein